MKLDFKAETVGQYGGITGVGAASLLGAPHLDLIDIVVREAVQNSWDARLSSRIHFGVMAKRFDDVEADALEDALSDGLNPKSGFHRHRKAGSLDALVLFDRGTKGLGGDINPSSPGAADFARFVYMIGETKPQDGDVSTGGTYGYGRSSFIRASKINTILVHTICKQDGERQARLIGMSWRDQTKSTTQRYTGRTWWGVEKKGWIGPAINSDADRIARAIGMPIPGARELGTTIMILTPKWARDGDEGVASGADELAVERVKDSLLYNCWPRMLDGSLEFSLEWFGEKVRLPPPQEHPRLRHFARAFEIATTEEKRVGKFAIECLKPEMTLGSLGLVKTAFAPGIEDSDADGVRDSSRPLHHVALMRNTRLVVKYMEGAHPPIEGTQYAGAFIADPEIDRVLAASEPPSHDDWVKKRLETRREQTLVNVTFKRLSECVRTFLGPASHGDDTPTDGSDLASLSDELGALLPGNDGGGPGEAARKTRGGGRSGGRVGPGSSGRLNELDIRQFARGGTIYVEVPFELVPTGEDRMRVSVTAAVAVDGGGAESKAPAGAALPEIVGWYIGDAEVRGSRGKTEIDVRTPDNVSGHVLIRQPPDCAVRVSLAIAERPNRGSA